MTEVEKQFSSLILVGYLGQVKVSFPPLSSSEEEDL